MSPLRIIILIILGYLVYRLIFGSKKQSMAKGGSRKKPSSEGPESDTLVEDPVCKKLVPSKQALQFEWQGQRYYFCSQACCNIFRTTKGENG